MSISIIIPTFNDNYYLHKLIKDIINQDYPHKKIEIIIIEAGNNSKKNIENLLRRCSIRLNYIHKVNLDRNKSLNLGFSSSVNELIVRLDARTHIESDYLSKLQSLSKKTGCINVGGVKIPIGESPKQKFIAKVMSNPFCLGGAKFRKNIYEGYADTVYLGCYVAEEVRKKFFFENYLLRISEDADFNLQLIKDNNKIFVSSRIKAFYYCRETFPKFFNLMFNYGVSRGLFVIKNKSITSLRQIILPLSSIIMFTFFSLSFFNSFFILPFATVISFYFIFLFFVSLIYERFSFVSSSKLLCGLVGTHMCWTAGFFYSIKMFLEYKFSN